MKSLYSSFIQGIVHVVVKDMKAQEKTWENVPSILHWDFFILNFSNGKIGKFGEGEHKNKLLWNILLLYL